MKAGLIAKLFLLFLLLALAGGLFWRSYQASRVPKSAESSPTTEERLFSIQTAEEIGDPMERCLAYPNLPEYHWSEASVVAFCNDQFTPTFTWQEFKSAIDDGKASEVDLRLDDLLAGYFAGRIPEGAWMRMYSNIFYGSSAANVELVEKWLRLAPDSAHAFLARGLQEYSVAAAARGEDTHGNTDPEALERMHAAAERSKDLLDRSLAINERLLPAYRTLIWIAKYQGDDKLAERALHQANRVDPANFYVRAAMMEFHEPRWGGSFQLMDSLAAESQTYQRQNPRLSNLPAMAAAVRGMPMYFDHDYSLALSRFEEGLAHGPVGFYLAVASHSASQIDSDLRAVELSSQILRFEPDNVAALHRRQYHLRKLARDSWAMSDIENLLRIDAGDKSALQAYAMALIKLNDNEAAESKLKQLIASDPGNRWAKENLSWLYGYRLARIEDADLLIGEMLEEQPEDGALWLLRVRLLESHAGPRMREAVESFLRYADETSIEQRKMIPIAKKWLATHS